MASGSFIFPSDQEWAHHYSLRLDGYMWACRQMAYQDCFSRDCLSYQVPPSFQTAMYKIWKAVVRDTWLEEMRALLDSTVINIVAQADRTMRLPVGPEEETYHYIGQTQDRGGCASRKGLWSKVFCSVCTAILACASQFVFVLH